MGRAESGRPRGRLSGRCLEQAGDERDFAVDARLFVMDMAALDGADRFDAAQSCFGSSQGPEALPISQETLHCGVIAFDQVVSPLSVDVPNAVEVRIIPVIDLPDHKPVGGGA